MASRDGPRPPPPKSDPKMTATSSGQHQREEQRGLHPEEQLEILERDCQHGSHGRCPSVSGDRTGQSRSERPVRCRKTCSSVGIATSNSAGIAAPRAAAWRLSSASGSRVSMRSSPSAVRRISVGGPPCVCGQAAHGVEREQLAVVDDRDAIAEALGFLHVVRRVDDRLARRASAPAGCRRSRCATADRRRPSARRAARRSGSWRIAAARLRRRFMPPE